MKTLVVQRVGSNRGGWDSFLETWRLAEADRGVESSKEILEHLTLPDPGKLPVKLEIVDPKENRAARLASAWQLRGIQATARQATVEDCLDEDVDLRMLAIDNPRVIGMVIERGSQRFLQAGILVAANFPPGGGRVVGIGLSIQEQDREQSLAAGNLMRAIADLVGEPTHSQEMALPIQTPQMISVRRLLHRELAIDTLKFTGGQAIASRLFAVETLSPRPPHVYKLEVAEEQGPINRSRLDALAIEGAAKNGVSTVTAFFQQKRAWLYLLFVHQLEEWVVRHRVELPTPEEYLRIFEEARPRVEESSSHVVATD